VKKARPRGGAGDARLLHGRTTVEVADSAWPSAWRPCAWSSASTVRGHLPGYADLVRDFIAEKEEAGKAWPPPRG
jgi:hypothetical protein